jgi:hypothetical protein
LLPYLTRPFRTIVFYSYYPNSINILNMPPSKRRISSSWILTFLTTILILLFYFRYHSPTITKSSSLQILESNPTQQPSTIRIAKATIAYEPSNSIYNRSLELHSEHNERFGYGMHVLRTPTVREYANTLLWLQHVMVGEMMKKGEGAVWILYVHQSAMCLLNGLTKVNQVLHPNSHDGK